MIVHSHDWRLGGPKDRLWHLTTPVEDSRLEFKEKIQNLFSSSFFEKHFITEPMNY